MAKRYKVWIKIERPDGSTYRQLVFDELVDEVCLVIDRNQLENKLGKGYHIVEFMGECENE